MYQPTSLAVMATLLIDDIRNKYSAKGKGFRNPYQLFSYGSFHGGVQR